MLGGGLQDRRAGPLQLKTNVLGPLQEQCAGPGPRIYNLDQNSFYTQYLCRFGSEHRRKLAHGPLNVRSPKVTPRPADVGVIYFAGIVFHIFVGGRSRRPSLISET